MTESENLQTAHTVDCSRCGQTAEAATGVAYGGKLGEEICARVCQLCWDEWERTEVMVINELRLNFMDPESQKVLIGQLREFLGLDAGSGETSS